MSPGGGGGVQKVWKKCHILFEWPLNRMITVTELDNVSTNTQNIKVFHLTSQTVITY